MNNGDIIVNLEMSKADIEILVKHGFFKKQMVYVLTKKGKLALTAEKPLTEQVFTESLTKSSTKSAIIQSKPNVKPVHVPKSSKKKRKK